MRNGSIALVAGLLLASCGSEAQTADSDEAPAATTEKAAAAAPVATASTPPATVLDFKTPLRCEPSAALRKLFLSMGKVNEAEGSYGAPQVDPATATLPDGSSAKARAMKAGEYGEPGLFLPLDSGWHGLKLAGVWISNITYVGLAEGRPDDGAHYRLFFDDAPDIQEKLRQAGWKFSKNDAEHGPTTVNEWGQQYYLDDNRLLDKPLPDYHAAAAKDPDGIPKVDGKQVGYYAMNTVVLLEKSRAMPGKRELSCEIYAST